jgi:hypothetical protein
MEGLELGALTLSHSTTLFCDFVFEIASLELCAGLDLNWDPPDLCLLSS